MNYDNILTKIFFISDNTINVAKLHKLNLGKYINILNYLNNRYFDSESINETLKRIKYNIEIRPTCLTCGGKVEYIGRKRAMYGIYCSNECRAKNPQYLEKCKNTYRLKTGYNHNSQNPENRKKYEETCLNKYGIKNSFWSPKREETCLNKYGTLNISSVESIKSKKDYKSISDKNINTKRINNTFNTSNDEEKLFVLLKDNFKNVIRQYKSMEYPFCCDFYLPDYDLYIEYQGSWTHGGHPFNQEDENDLSILKLWESKDTDYYRNAITTWTQRDVNKRNIAKENNLNWLEYFTNDFNYIIDDIKKRI